MEVGERFSLPRVLLAALDDDRTGLVLAYLKNELG
jgi:hypothetical protein